MPSLQTPLQGETLDGHDLDLLRVGREGEGKRRIWVVARQHPGESMAGAYEGAAAGERGWLYGWLTWWAVARQHPGESMAGAYKHGGCACWDGTWVKAWQARLPAGGWRRRWSTDRAWLPHPIPPCPTPPSRPCCLLLNIAVALHCAFPCSLPPSRSSLATLQAEWFVEGMLLCIIRTPPHLLPTHSHPALPCTPSRAEWFVEGMLRRLLDRADPVSRSLLRDTVFYVVPCMCECLGAVCCPACMCGALHA